MAFITRYFRKLMGNARLLCYVAFMLSMVQVGLPVALADEAAIAYVEVLPEDNHYIVNADVDFELNSRLSDALYHGISLYFIAEFSIEQPRWYWFDNVLAKASIHYRLSYAPITRNYRLSIGGIHRTYETLDSALATLRHIRSWSVADQNKLTPGEYYNAAFRLRLDTSQLPKPFQVTSAVNSKDWQLSTEWSRWRFKASSRGEAP